MNVGFSRWMAAGMLLVGAIFGNLGTVDAAEWAYRYGGGGDDTASDVVQTSDGGYVVAAETKSFGAGNSDAWIIKLDRQGSVQWEKAIGTAENDSVGTVRQTRDGGYIAAGWTRGYSSSMMPWVFKLNAAGNLEWQKMLSVSGGGQLLSVEQTNDGGFVLVGWGGPGLAALVIKLDSSGGVVWQKGFGNSGTNLMSSVRQTADGGFIAAGSTNAFGAGGMDAWVIRLDSGGSVLWQKAYGGTGHDRAYSIIQSAEGGYVFAGGTASYGAGSTDAWVVRINDTGGIVWQKTLGGSENDYLTSIRQASDGQYVAAGTTRSFGRGGYDVWLIRMRADGSMVSQTTLGDTGDEVGYAVFLTADGGYALAATGNSLDKGGADAWVIKLSPFGGIAGCFTAGFHITASTVDISAASTAGYVDVGAPAVNPGGAMQSTSAAVAPPSSARGFICTFNPAAIALHVPTTQEIYSYGTTVAPNFGSSGPNSKPLASGDIAGGVVELQVGFAGYGGYGERYDLYLGLIVPWVSDVFLFDSGNGIHSVSSGSFVKWRDNVTGGMIDESLIGVIPTSWLPHGTYYMLLIATPSGTFSSYYAWVTNFTL